MKKSMSLLIIIGVLSASYWNESIFNSALKIYSEYRFNNALQFGSCTIDIPSGWVILTSRPEHKSYLLSQGKNKPYVFIRYIDGISDQSLIELKKLSNVLDNGQNIADVLSVNSYSVDGIQVIKSSYSTNESGLTVYYFVGSNLFIKASGVSNEYVDDVLANLVLELLNKVYLPNKMHTG